MHISCLAASAQCSICDSRQYYIQFWFIFFFLLFLNIELWSTLVLVHFLCCRIAGLDCVAFIYYTVHGLLGGFLLDNVAVILCAHAFLSRVP